MDHGPYDNRYQQYSSQPQYWPYGYAQHVAPTQPDMTYATQSATGQPQDYQYGQHAQTPRQMASNEWALVASPVSQQPYVTPQSSHQYAQPMSAAVAPPVGYIQYPQQQMHHAVLMAPQMSQSVLNYQTPTNTYAYYQQDPQRALTLYRPTAHPHSTPYASTTATPVTPTSHYHDSRSASINDQEWSLVDYSDNRHSMEHYVEMQQATPVSTHHTTSQQPQPMSNGSTAPLQASVSTNTMFGPALSHAQEDNKSLADMHSDGVHTHDNCTHHSSPSTDHDSHSPSTSTSSHTRDPTPLLPCAQQAIIGPVAPPKSSLKKTVSTALVKKELAADKRVGKRKGPLKPEQRKQAGEIRKLKACLRCKFLKKTCDTGNPCSGCTPAHARLWQVPCTRIAIQEVGYFTRDFTADINREYPFGEIVAESPMQVGLWITHGFGYVLPVMSRAVYVKNAEKFKVEWSEVQPTGQRQDFEAVSANLAPIEGSISEQVMSEYVDKHIDGGFERFVDNHFDGTKFITEMLKTTYNHYRSTKLPIIRKALKLVVAYNLTMSLTLAEGLPEDAAWAGKVTDPESRQYGKIPAPVLVNREVKHALAGLWRALMNDVLIELAKLYTSVYSGDRLKHWPTIFMLDLLLLAVWEEMQFDMCYAANKAGEEMSEAPERFCQQMESIPVGVIVGLFLAISQKLPTFLEWDSKKHHHVLNSDQQACDVMNEVKKHVIKHGTSTCLYVIRLDANVVTEDYLKKRPKECRFNVNDMDSLSNKFVSRLVVRAN